MKLSRREMRELRRQRREEERRIEESRKARAERNKKIAYGVFALVVIGVMGYAFYLNTQPRPPVTGLVAGSHTEGGSFVKGDPDAPVTIVEFSDFQCPFCRRFFMETLPKIEKEYIATGKAKLIFRHFPLVDIHPYAMKAAEASLCAGEQGKFWEMHDMLFTNSHLLDINSLKSYAAELGLDTEKFNYCLDSGQKAGIVQRDVAEGRSLGITGTPFFLINGEPLRGAQPFINFKTIIDRELEKASQE